MLTRRSVIRVGAQLTLLAPFAQLARAEPIDDPRFVLVILRGGLDGLAAVAPYGDPSYAPLRGQLALGRPGTEGGVLKLDDLFGLHPSLSSLHEMYGASELVVLHAAATPYRERSHFDAQKVLEAGAAAPSAASGGWLNRALTELARERGPKRAIAIADSVPLVLRGDYAVDSWAPTRLPDANDDTLARVQALYAAADPRMAARLTSALEARGLAADVAVGGRDRRGGGQLGPLAAAAARFLAADDGPRIAVLDVGGWDTHANQGAAQGALALRLRALDAGLQTLRNELDAVWRSTSVLIVTEFGRTVAVNGTRGTDHGTAGCALLAGGAVDGGRVIADWPGLGARDLHEGRDLRATLDLRAVFKGVLADGFGLSSAALERVFPDSTGVGTLRLLKATA